MLTIIFVESALETVPRELWSHPAVRNYAVRRGKLPRFTILDRSYHHAAMKTLNVSEKRGRPDIVHFSLLEALGSPLNKEGLLRVFVHTINDHLISVASKTRLPRNCNRFIGLMESLFMQGRVPQRGDALLTIECKSMHELIDTIKPDYVIAFSRFGEPTTMENAISRLSNHSNLAALIGGFPAGHFADSTLDLANEIVCIDKAMLEAWTVTSRLIYEYEKSILIAKRRLADI